MIKEYIKESQQTLILGVPFIINQLLQISIFAIDTIMAGADGKLTLAAVAQGGSLFLIAQLVLIGLALPLAPMFARLFTRQEYSKIRELFQQSIWLVLFLSVLGIILMLFLPNVLWLIKVKEAIIPPATSYMHIMTFSIPFFACYLPVRYLSEGMSNPKIVMYITALSIPFNIIGNYIFLNGLFGLPRMGAAGVGLSSLISLVFVSIAGWVYISSSNRLKEMQLLKNLQAPNVKLIIRVLKVGFPNAIALLMEAGMFSAITLLSGRLGVSIAAANQIAINYISIAFMIPLGLSFAITTRVSMAMGHNNLRQARVIGLSGIMIGMMSMVLSVIVILVAGESIPMRYSQDKAIIDIAVGLLSIAAIFQVFDGIQVSCAGALRGLEETKSPMIYAILGYWVIAMPVGIVLAFYYDMQARGLWFGLLFGLGITAILGVVKFMSLTKE